MSIFTHLPLLKLSTLAAISLTLSACATSQSPSSQVAQSNQVNAAEPAKTEAASAQSQVCLGSVAPPANWANLLLAVDDQTLLNNALGEAGKGKLCQGKVYQVKPDQQLTIYRAWNSTNPGSQFGQWWAASQPSGKVAIYREQYEICYQWSPLDKMTQCTLKAGSKLVIGNGQSAVCSQYLTYPVSASQQLYIENAQALTDACTTFDAVFSWQ